MMKSTAIANSNIALIKYWGKRDQNLFLPQNSSISMTLDGLNTTTTVEFDSKYKEDEVVINGKRAEGKVKDKITRHIDIIRKKAGITERAKIVTQNNFPTAAGLASSASGFAALTLASSRAAGLDLNEKELSILSRMGSGSACRSVVGGFVKWVKGREKDGSDSYAIQLAPPDWWDIRMIVLVIESGEKKIKSRAGMQKTVETCPYYRCWLDTIENDIEEVEKGIKERDIELVGQAAERNALKMHALMFTTIPPIIYWKPETIKAIEEVFKMREEGIKAYFTMDAGPNVKILCTSNESEKVRKVFESREYIKQVIVCPPGEGVREVNEHLF